MACIAGLKLEEIQMAGINPNLFTCHAIKSSNICTIDQKIKAEVEDFNTQVHEQESPMSSIKEDSLPKTEEDPHRETEKHSSPNNNNNKEDSPRRGTIQRFKKQEPTPYKVVHRSKKIKYVQPVTKPRWKSELWSLDFRDPILTQVDIKNYHYYLQDESTQSLIQNSIRCTGSKVSHFTYNSKRFLAIAWLSTVRIYEYRLKTNSYVEIKRIPDRYIKISPKVLTSIHFDEQPILYMAFLWGSDAPNADPMKPFIEIRDITGNQIGQQYFYDCPVSDIKSDSLFVYVKTKSNSLNLHRRKCFNMIHTIDLSPPIDNPIINFYLERPQCDSITKLPIVTITSKEMKLMNYSRHSGLRSGDENPYITNNQYKISKVEKIKKNFIVLTNATNSLASEFTSIIEVTALNGKLGAFTSSYSLRFKSSHIVQMKAHRDQLFILGYQGPLGQQIFYELCCLRLRGKPEPVWTTYITAVDDKSQIVVQGEHVAIVTSIQEILVINTATRKKIHCDSCKIQLLSQQDWEYHCKVHTSMLTDNVIT